MVTCIFFGFFMIFGRTLLELVQLSFEEDEESALRRLDLMLLQEGRVKKITDLLVR